jgi:hypothetical protein
MNREKAIKQINALLAKTVENSATREEHRSALSKAQELMRKHGVDWSELEEPNPSRPVSVGPVVTSCSCGGERAVIATMRNGRRVKCTVCGKEHWQYGIKPAA